MKKLISLSVTVIAGFLLVSAPVTAADSDSDFWDDTVDNCITIPNSDQRDSDADSVGNVCDNCPFHYNPLQVDMDSDDLGDVCDPPPSSTGAIPGNDDEAVHACIVSAFANPNNFFDVKGATAVFDTGADVIVLGGVIALAIDPAREFFNPGDSQTVSNIALDSRNMGLQTGNQLKGWPTLAPEAAVQDVWIRVLEDDNNVPILVGAPFANQVYAYIDHTRIITVGPEVCPAVSFFPDATGIPDSLFFVNLQRFATGSPSPGSSTQPTGGYRYYIRGMRFVNGSNIVESPASGPITSPSRFLYDTGNKTTQISTDVALGLGITISTPVDMIKSINGQSLNGYRISRVEIDANDLSYTYVINNALVFVKPPPTGEPPDEAFKGDADVNIGNNFFETTQVLFDGAGNRIGLFKGVREQSASAPINLLLLF